MTRIGDLDRRVRLYQDTGAAQSPLGAHEEVWTLQGSRWAQITPDRGSEAFREEAERARQAIVITIFYDDLTKTVGPAWRMIYDADGVSREYDIQSVGDVDSAHEFITVRALLRSPEAARVP